MSVELAIVQHRLTHRLEIEMAINFGLMWSQQNYKGLTPEQHRANNAWFAKMASITKPGGIIMVPNLGKAFYTNGKPVR